jgi:hypothetical protein
MKHYFRQDYRINRIFICLVGHYPVDPVDPVRKLNRQNTLFDAYSPPEEDSMLDVRCSMFIRFFFDLTDRISGQRLG